MKRLSELVSALGYVVAFAAFLALAWLVYTAIAGYTVCRGC